MSHYFLITAYPVAAELEDPLSGFFFGQGADGVSEDLDFSQFDDQYTVETKQSDLKRLNIYFLNKPSENLLLKASALFPKVNFKIEQEVSKDWMLEWKKGFHAFTLTDGVQVIPSWERKTDSLGLKIFIDPGMAFGTGTHATTKIAASFLNSLEVTEKSVLDVGTGTGILAILADHKKAQLICATEIDEVARSVAKENIVFNNCKNTSVFDHQIEKVEGLFDVVIANIIDGVLVRIQKDLVKRVKPGGFLILTGILEERETSFLQDFDLSQFAIVNKMQKDEWVGFLLQKRSL